MAQEGLNLLQQAFKGLLKCLGLEKGGGENVANNGETLNTTDPEPSSYDTPIIDPVVEVLSSPIDGSTATSEDISYNSTDTNLVTIDEIINTVGGVIAEAHYVDLDGGNSNMTLISTRLMSTGGGGKSN